MTLTRIVSILMCLVVFPAVADINTPYTTHPLMISPNASAEVAQKAQFKSGWYAHKKDVTYIKLIQIGNNMGLSVLFSSTGLFCPIAKYLPFNRVSGSANAYSYAVGNGCLATITMNPQNSTFVMTVNSRSKCFEEYTYQEFCNGNLDVHMINEHDSTYFINRIFTYANDQNDNDYDWDAD